MHSAALQLAPVLAEKSKVPFYVAGGVLVLWALTVSAGLGLRRAAFPFTLGGERVVIAISVVLVLTAVSMAVITSGAPAPASSGASSSAPSQPSGGAPSTSAAQPSAPTTSSKSSGGRASVSALRLSAASGGALAYNTKQLKARAGKVSIMLTNGGPIEHDVTIAQGSHVLGATPVFVGGSRTVTLSLGAGTYTFYCSVPGHRQAGMEGTLSVS